MLHLHLAEAVEKAKAGWNPEKHPRGRDGKFIEVGDLVRVFSGPESQAPDLTGTVEGSHFAPDGRMFIAVHPTNGSYGEVKWFRPKQIEQVNAKAMLGNPTEPLPEVGTKDATHLMYHGSAASTEIANDVENNPKLTPAEKYALFSNPTVMNALPAWAKQPMTPQEKELLTIPDEHVKPYSALGIAVAKHKNEYPVIQAIKENPALTLDEKQMLYNADPPPFPNEVTLAAWQNTPITVAEQAFINTAVQYPGALSPKTNMVIAKAKLKHEYLATHGVGPTGLALNVTPPPTPDKPTTPGPLAPVKIPKGKTPADLIRMVYTSALNKGLTTSELNSVHGLIEAALDPYAKDSPGVAKKQLAKAMTLAKLGGKQRARYNQLLAQHHGWVDATNVAPSPASMPHTAASGKHISATPPKGSASWNYVQAQQYVNPDTVGAGEAKAKIQKDLAARMSDVPAEDFVDLYYSPFYGDGEGTMLTLQYKQAAKGTPSTGSLSKSYDGSWQYLSNNTGSTSATKENLAMAVRENAIRDLIALWASTSNDQNPRSLAMQEAAVKEFELHNTYDWHTPLATTQKELDRHEQVFRRFLREMYNATQQDLKARGITHVRVKRGFNPTQQAKTAMAQAKLNNAPVELSLRPMSSFSANPSTATGFGHSLISGYVPVERIIGSAVTGFGCKNEYEFVVLGGTDQWKVEQAF